MLASAAVDGTANGQYFYSSGLAAIVVQGFTSVILHGLVWVRLILQQKLTCFGMWWIVCREHPT